MCLSFGLSMAHVNIEFKARCSNTEQIRKILKSRQAKFIGTDHQVDSYFTVKSGRLKLREGNIENSLIYYERSDSTEPKQSDVILYHPNLNSISLLKEILTKTLGINVIVDKEREIYFIDNVKFHIDTVKHLASTFIEVEAIDEDGTIGITKLKDQCLFYLKLFGIPEKDLISKSYSDLLLKLLK